MLDERKSAVLRTVVNEYIQTAQPVGSTHVVRDPTIGVSPATVRADMAALEREGYLTHPHTSAGRIPTDKGYRFFVDHFCSPGTLGTIQRQQIRDFFSSAHGEFEQMLRDTSTLLSQLTAHAAVVVAPASEALTVRQAILVDLSNRTALLVIVLSNGAVIKHTIELTSDQAGIEEASAHLHAHLTGRVVGDGSPLPPTGSPAVDAVLTACTAALGDLRQPVDLDHVYVGGASRMAEAFDAVETVRSVLRILEQSYIIVSLLTEVTANGRTVSIGSEHGVEPLAECSLVVAPYKGGDKITGTIGVLGPTRMDYSHALAAVAVVGQRLSRQLSGD